MRNSGAIIETCKIKRLESQVTPNLLFSQCSKSILSNFASIVHVPLYRILTFQSTKYICFFCTYVSFVPQSIFSTPKLLKKTLHTHAIATCKSYLFIIQSNLQFIPIHPEPSVPSRASPSSAPLSLSSTPQKPLNTNQPKVTQDTLNSLFLYITNEKRKPVTNHTLKFHDLPLIFPFSDSWFRCWVCPEIYWFDRKDYILGNNITGIL